MADTSAWSWSRRRAHQDLRSWFDEELVGGRIATCEMVRLELLHSARDAHEFEGIESELTVLPQCPIGPVEWARARWVYGGLATRAPAFQRSLGHADLLIAAAAESAGLTLLHYDSDYESIAKITGQPTRWLAPRGSLG